jgi:hypothetical protein
MVWCCMRVGLPSCARPSITRLRSFFGPLRRVERAMIIMLFLVILFTVLPVADAQISGGTLITPGQAPAVVTPTPNGGAIVIRPGQAPAFLTPTPRGGTIWRPGEGPSFFIPTPTPFGSSIGSPMAPYGITLPGATLRIAPYGITLPDPPSSVR